VLLRAQAIDKAARRLLAEAKDSITEPGTAGSISQPVPRTKNPARLAASSFPASPGAAMAANRNAGPPLQPHPAVDDQAVHPTASLKYMRHGRLVQR
jgi:hypothetical protein